MRFSLLLALIAVTAEAAKSVIPTSYDGSPLPYTTYGPGGCSESTKLVTGETLSLKMIAPNFLCEKDVLNIPEVGPTTLYTKFESVNCGSDTIDWKLYNCTDETCSACDDAPEVEASMASADAYEWLYSLPSDDPQTSCATWYPSNNYSDFAVGGIQSMSSQAFDASVGPGDSQEYWTIFFGNTCGAEWLSNLTGAEYTAASSGPAEQPQAEESSTEQPVATTPAPSAAPGVVVLLGVSLPLLFVHVALSW